MIDHRRAFRSIRAGFALFCIVLLAAACNLGAPQEQALPTQDGVTTVTVPATRTLIPGVPTSRVVTTTPIPFPTRVVQVFPTAYVPPQTNPQPTAQPLPYNIVILSPLPGNVIGGNVAVLGSASHPQFLQYRLEFGPDPNPNNLWFPISGVVQSTVINGTLGVWSTNAGGSPDGFYQIRLRVFMRDGSQQITTVNNIRVQNQAPTPVPTATQSTPRPIAAFTNDPITGTAPLVVRFFNQSQGQITSYLWNFGTGNLSSAINPIETFTKPGIYNVTLSVNGPGGSANVTRQINVTSPGAPTASFIPNILSGPLGPKGLEVSFTNRSTGNITTYDWDFGDGTVSKEVNPKHLFKAVGNYNVILKATGPGGSNSIVRLITVSNPQIPAPVADFVPGTTSGPIDSVITFSNKSTGDITAFQWDLDGNGYTDSTDKDPTFQYTKAGKFSVTLRVIGTGGQSSKTVQIEIKAPLNAPVVNFTADKTTIEAGQTVAFTNNTTGDVTKYEWDLDGNGGMDSAEKNPTFKYDNPGTFIVRLKASGPGGSASKDLTITVKAPVPAAPVAKFTVDKTSGQSPLKVIFTNDSTGQIDSFAWDFNGDTKTDNTVDGVFEYTFTSPGTYAASLTVSNAGGTDTEQVTITVSAPPGAPTASFTALPATGDAPLEVVFTNTSTGTVDKIEWDFENDGTIDSSSTEPVKFTYTKSGTYTAKLIASNTGGSASATQTIVVKDKLPDAPVAIFTADPTSGDGSKENPLNVTFTSTSTGTIDKIEWDFNGDGTNDNLEDSVATFGFDTPGTYEAKLTVSNAGGSNSATVTIQVNAPAVDAPVADFTASPTSGEKALKVTFTNASSGEINTYSWDIDGDGSEDSVASSGFDFTYENVGTYEAALTVTGPGGTNTKYVTINVTESVVIPPDAPVASFTANPTSIKVNESVTFTNTSTGNVESLAWDFDGDNTVDNTTLGNAPVTFPFSKEGTFTASLTVTNAGGSTTAQQTIIVGSAAPAAPVAAFTTDKTTINVGESVTFTNASTGQVDSLAWDFDGNGSVDNTTLGNAPVSFQFNTAGTFTAKLTVNNVSGSDMEQATIVVNTPLPNAPVASFTIDKTSIETNQSVTFANTSTGQVDSLAWDFDGNGSVDNTTLGNAPITIPFPTKGTYSAKLTVTNAAGSNETTQTITVTDPVPVVVAPVAGISASTTTVEVGQTVTFSSTSTGQVDSYTWTFGNGKPDANTADASTTFDTPGTYNVILTVGNAGGTNQITQPITVNAAPPVVVAPVAGFTAPASAAPNTDVQFNSSTSTGQIDSYSWDFDGQNGPDSTDPNPIHQYPAVGVYPVSLTVTNAGGSNTFLQNITIEAVAVPPVADFTADPGDTVDAGTPVTLTITSTGVESFVWDFGNGTQNTTDNPVTLPFTDGGPYSITLSVTGAGQTSTITKTITFNAAAPTVPDGQIVYVSGGDIYTSRTDGSDVQPLTSEGDDQEISFAQNKIVFIRDLNGAKDIYLINDINNPSDVTQLTTDAAGYSDPVLSPNGSKVAFVMGTDIYTIDVSNPSLPPVPLTAGTDGSNEFQPAWSADSGKIIFVSNRPAADSSTDNEIYIMDANGNNPLPLTNNSDDDRDPAWAPDSSLIAYTSNANGGNDNIWTMTSIGDSPIQLTDNGSSQSQPSWTSDSLYILYISNEGGGNAVYIMTRDGDEETLLTNGDAGQWR